MQSARSFALAWFGGGSRGEKFAKEVQVHPRYPLDKTLRFFECIPYDKYREEKKREREENVQHLIPLAKELTRRLDLSRELEPRMARVLLHWCMYDIARGEEKSRFCQLLKPSEVLVVEQAEMDIESFLYAHTKFNWVAVPLLRDILDSIRSCGLASGSTCTQACLRFAHAETVVPLVLLLGLGETADKTWQCRSWIASTSPMSANVAVEVYQRRSGSLYVKFRLNERCADIGVKQAERRNCHYLVLITLFSMSLSPPCTPRPLRRYVLRIGACSNRDYCSVEELTRLCSTTVSTSQWETMCARRPRFTDKEEWPAASKEVNHSPEFIPHCSLFLVLSHDRYCFFFLVRRRSQATN